MIGLLRIKDEFRWIERCVRSIQPVCDRILVLDDHSTDATPEICAALGCAVYRSEFEGLDEARDKSWLLDKVRGEDWVLMIDGDEMLEPADAPKVYAATLAPFGAWSFRIAYLWDSEYQVRTDGIYGQFRRPSMFRPRDHRFVATGRGGNFHCGNVPLGIQHTAQPLDATLLHFGYMHREDRLRKFDWYNEKDPGNVLENEYKHMVIGDRFPPDSRFRHAGPLQLEAR